MEDSVNPAVPGSTGALLAEEWTINPLAALPSFLEMFLMDEANRSARKSLDAGMRFMARKLAIQARAIQALAAQPRPRQRQTQQPPQPQGEIMSTGGSSSSSSSSFVSKLIFLLQNSSAKFAATLARFMERFGPEISCLVLYALERSCLRSDACATISESLYGGRQAKLDPSSSSSSSSTSPSPNANTDNNNDKGQQRRKLLPLTDRDKTRYALLVTVLPYLRQKLLLWYQKQQSSSSSSSLDHANRLSVLLYKLKKIFVLVYPMLHLSMSGLDLLYQWRYMLGHSVFFTPSSHLLGLVVRRVTMEDTLINSQQQQQASKTPTMGDKITTSTTDAIGNRRGAPTTTTTTTTRMTDSSSSTATMSSTLRNLTVVGLSTAVILSWVSHFRAEFRRQRQELIMEQQQQQQQQQEEGPSLMQGQQHYHHYHSNQTGTTTPLPPPPPPPCNAMMMTMVMNNNHAIMPAHLCPLCRQPRVNPTASSSGFVFCYKCLLLHVKEKGSCPVTGRTCKEAQLLRLYEPTTNDTNHQTTHTTTAPAATTNSNT